MPYSHAKVDLNLIPEGEFKTAIIDLATKHNALVDGTNEVKIELDKITGQTLNEKAEMHTVFEKLRGFVGWMHSKRVNTSLIGFQAMCLVMVLKWLGITPDQIGNFMAALIKLIERFAQ